MISVCLNGQTGPHKDYPGFGGQGSALGGYNVSPAGRYVPIGPFGTITDSLVAVTSRPARGPPSSPAGRTEGVYLDIADVETVDWSLSPWLLDYEVDGLIRLRTAIATRGGVLRTVRSGAWTKARSATGGSRSPAGRTPSGRRSHASSASTTTPGLRSFGGRKAREDETRSARIGVDGDA